MKYKLKPRYWMCQCGHPVCKHKKINLLFIYLINYEAPCDVCECPKFETETVTNGSES